MKSMEISVGEEAQRSNGCETETELKNKIGQRKSQIIQNSGKADVAEKTSDEVREIELKDESRQVKENIIVGMTMLSISDPTNKAVDKEICLGEEANTSKGLQSETEVKDMKQVIREQVIKEIELKDDSRQVKEKVIAEEEKPDITLSISISDPTKKAMENLGIKNLNTVQARAIPLLLEGKDVTVAAECFSGKTLALLISAVELLYQCEFTPERGAGVIVLCHSREHAIAVFQSAELLLKYHTQTPGLCVGLIARPQAEKSVKGANLLIATPEILLDHLQNTEGFIYGNLKCLMIEEADWILKLDSKVIRKILRILPEGIQIALSSRIITMKVRNLRPPRTPHVYVAVLDRLKKRVGDALFDPRYTSSRKKLTVSTITRELKSCNLKAMELQSKNKK